MMPSSNWVKFTLDTAHPRFLDGLEALLQMGLIGDEFVRLVGRSHLSCEIPEYVALVETVDATPIAIESPPQPTAKPREPILPTVWKRLVAELSVRWLLFLGVFLVVLSSGVLVASQWANFPAVGQYGVLWSYTVVFGLVGYWAKGEHDLQLTARTLQTVAMLLVPLNFWAVDQLGIWQSPPQAGMAIALMGVLLWGVYGFSGSQGWSKPMMAGFLSLGFCHWRWDWVFAPVVAVYVGIGIIIVILWGLPLLAKRSHPQKIPEPVGLEFLLFGLGLLLFRAIAITHVPIGVLGFGIGALGWLLTALEQIKIKHSHPSDSTEAIAHPWESSGAILMLLGWLVTVGRYDWQVLGVSALAVAWLWEKLRRDWLGADLVALFVVGLQGGILCRNVIPSTVKTTVTTAAVNFSQAYDFPYAIYGVTLLPYLLIWAIAAVWLYRQGKQQLAHVSEYLVLSLGVSLAGLSIANPTWRAINFTIAAGVWFYFTEYTRPDIRRGYLYLCHGMTLLALGGIVERFLPNLNLFAWGNLCLLGLLLEWGCCLLIITHRHRRLWQMSSWHYGIVLAIASVILLWVHPVIHQPLVRLVWLIVPVMATLIAVRHRRGWRRDAVGLSVFSLATLPILQTIVDNLSQWQTGTFITLENWLFLKICLAIAVGLMTINVRLMPIISLVHLHLAFIVILGASLIGQQLHHWQWLIMGAIAAGICWGVTLSLGGRRQYLGRLYRRTCHQWGLLLAGIVALILTKYCLNLWRYFDVAFYQPEILISSGLLFVIVLGRYWQIPREEAFILGGIALEGLMVTTVKQQGGTALAIAVMHLLLATFFLGWQRTNPESPRLSIWQAYPLLFTLSGWLWRWGYFTTYTGLTSFFAGILLLAIAVTYPRNRLLRVLGFSGITLGIYESVIYQMSQRGGNNVGDALTILALVGIIIALIDRSLYWLFTKQNRTHIAAIPLTEILSAAHLHWFLAAAFKLFTLPYFLNEPPSLKILAIAVNIGLVLYAVIQARNPVLGQAKKSSDWWIYVGTIELISTGIQARWLWQELTTLDPFRVFFVSVIALLILQLPWSELGWQKSPWQRVGMALPALCLAATATDEVSYLSLASISFVYIRLAQIQHNIRWSYISLIFGNWLIAKILVNFDLTQPLSYALQIGLSILLIAQLDPSFTQHQQRQWRHYWRLIGSGIICTIALIYYQELGLTPAIISLTFIFLAFGTQIRAFLYNGTMTLLLTSLYQLVILIDRYSFAKWIIGLVTGILLISIAANFEKHRLQILVVLETWLEELHHWQ